MPEQRLLFITAFDYPARYAHALHGLAMARAFTALLGNRFFFFINTALDPNQLAGIPYKKAFGRWGRRLKKMHLRKMLLPASLFIFFITNPAWRKATLLANDPNLLPILWVFAYLFNSSFAFECHGTLTPFQKRIAARAHGIFFTTRHLRDDFLAEYPACGSRSTVLPNAVDLSVFAAVTDDKSVLRKELGLPQERFILGYLGRFSPYEADKGLRTIIDALSELPPQVHGLLVGGTKKETQEYSSYAEERGVATRVSIVQHVAQAEVPRYAKAADVLCYVPQSSHFSERETSPMKLYEYMAAQRPVIASDTPALRDVLGEGAVYVKAGSVTSFASSVKKMMQEGGVAGASALFSRVKGNTWNSRASSMLVRLDIAVE